MKTSTSSLATYLGYNFVSVTQGMNGYPHCTYMAVVDFYDFEEAQEFAKSVNGSVVILSRKFGQQLYTNNGTTYTGLETSAFVDDNNFATYTNNYADEFEKFGLTHIKELIDMGTDLCYVAEISEKMSNIYNELTTIDDDEILIVNTNNWTVEDTTKQVVTKLSYDSTEYIVAVVDYETDDDVIDEEN